jgi:hypothetical protein
MAMTDRIPLGNAGNTDQNPNIFLAFSLWNPFLAGALKGNAQANQCFRAIMSESQDFVARRLRENLLLMQRLTHSSTPDQVLVAYTDFWSKAAEDYGHEITTMSNLMTGVTAKMVTAAQSAVDESASNVFPPRKAA